VVLAICPCRIIYAPLFDRVFFCILYDSHEFRDVKKVKTPPNSEYFDEEK